MIKKGKPRQLGRGECPDMADWHPEGVNIRVGKGLQPFAYEQDCAIYEDNKDRIQVIDYVDNAGVVVPVIRIIGDGVDANGKMRTGGAYMLAPLDNPCTWQRRDGVENHSGVRQRVVFSPQSPVQQDWYFNVELRGELSFRAKNEVSSCVLIAIKNEVVKVAWFRDAVDGDGGGQRIVKEFPFRFKQGDWYEAKIELTPYADELNTWWLYYEVRNLKHKRKSVWSLVTPDEMPNRIKSVTMIGMGDEQQQLTSGGTWLVSVFEDERLAAEKENPL